MERLRYMAALWFAERGCLSRQLVALALTKPGDK
jgi:hypothetical protein